MKSGLVGLATRVGLVRRVTSVVIAATAAILVSGCRQSRNVQFARLVERAASWSAAAQFATEMGRAGKVPSAYIRDLSRHGSEEGIALRSKIGDLDDAPPAMKSEGAELCERLASSLQAASAGDREPDVDELRRIEGRLRALAQNAREGAQPPRRSAR